jgi:hypothetical protein
VQVVGDDVLKVGANGLEQSEVASTHGESHCAGVRERRGMRSKSEREIALLLLAL